MRMVIVMNKEMKAAINVTIVAVSGALVGLLLAYLFPFTKGKHSMSVSTSYPLNMALSIANLFLLSALLYTYMKDYKEIKARFTLGLIIFLIALLFQTIFTLPIIHVIFGFSSASLGPFSALTNIFELIALSIFLYLSTT
jgi:hypothetical protein